MAIIFAQNLSIRNYSDIYLSAKDKGYLITAACLKYVNPGVQTAFPNVSIYQQSISTLAYLSKHQPFASLDWEWIFEECPYIYDVFARYLTSPDLELHQMQCAIITIKYHI